MLSRLCHLACSSRDDERSKRSVHSPAMPRPSQTADIASILLGEHSRLVLLPIDASDERVLRPWFALPPSRAPSLLPREIMQPPHGSHEAAGGAGGCCCCCWPWCGVSTTVPADTRIVPPRCSHNHEHHRKARQQCLFPSGATHTVSSVDYIGTGGAAEEARRSTTRPKPVPATVWMMEDPFSSGWKSSGLVAFSASPTQSSWKASAMTLHLQHGSDDFASKLRLLPSGKHDTCTGRFVVLAAEEDCSHPSVPCDPMGKHDYLFHSISWCGRSFDCSGQGKGDDSAFYYWKQGSHLISLPEPAT